jgi:radical SAM protein with 4Fe4S-binding SPASM domain
MSSAIILLHGFSGSPANLLPIAGFLSRQFPDCRVLNPALTGGWQGDLTPFALPVIHRQLAALIAECRDEAANLILLGHSTGGSLILSLLEKGIISQPDLLILVGSPGRITSDYYKRWQRHSTETGPMSLTATAHLISLIKSTAGRPLAQKHHPRIPAMILQGEEDELISADAAFDLQNHVFSGKARIFYIPGLKHHFSAGDRAALYFLGILKRAINDLIKIDPAEDRKAIAPIIHCEPELGPFINLSPASVRHIAGTPSGREVVSKKFAYRPTVTTDPVFANIEITTSCDLSCTYCARKFIRPAKEEMTRPQFNRLLDLLPHAYRVTVVGLGEPLLHPDLTGLINDIERRKRRSGIVTNATHLDRKKSKALLHAGLQSIAFSLDAARAKTMERVRPGCRLNQIIDNIKGFMDLAQAADRKLASAVFSALSQDTLDELDELTDLVSDLGVHVWMITDLNFQQHVSASLASCGNKADLAAQLRRALTRAFGRRLPVLPVRALEAFGLRARYLQYIPIAPDFLFQRSGRRRWCNSPWQTIAVRVNGDVTICDCQPDKIIGNLFTQPLSELWNGAQLAAFREEMLSPHPPAACLSCPRF